MKKYFSYSVKLYKISYLFILSYIFYTYIRKVYLNSILIHIKHFFFMFKFYIIVILCTITIFSQKNVYMLKPFKLLLLYSYLHIATSKPTVSIMFYS